MTDHHTGRTVRFIVEGEAESIAQIEAVLERTMADPAVQPKVAAAFAKLA